MTDTTDWKAEAECLRAECDRASRLFDSIATTHAKLAAWARDELSSHDQARFFAVLANGAPDWKTAPRNIAVDLRAVTAERDALAARLAEIGRAAPPSDHPEDDLEIGPVRRPSICTSAGNIGTGDLCTAYSETTGRCSHAAECDYQQHAPERVLGAELGRDLRAEHEDDLEMVQPPTDHCEPALQMVTARQLLTDEQIRDIVREASTGAATRRDGTTSTRIARAVERILTMAHPPAAEPARQELTALERELLGALQGAYSLAIGHAATYQHQHQLDEPHPTHAEILSQSRAAIAKASHPERTHSIRAETAYEVRPRCMSRGLLGATSGVGRECGMYIAETSRCGMPAGEQRQEQEGGAA